jgi:signal transduction histidine kinase
VGRQVKGTGGQLSGMGAGELETTNAMLRSVIDGIADPIYVKDAEGRYLLVNPAAASATGLRPDQILGYTTEEERADTERRRLLGRLHDIQEEERGRIAVGLHDGPLQGLATLGFELARARALLAEGRARVAGGGGFRFGLTVMTERVEALGGRLAVRSRAEGGTTVEARIPGLPARLEGRPA